MSNIYAAVTELKAIFDKEDARIAAMDSLTRAVHDIAIASKSQPMYSRVKFDGQIAWADVDYYL